jgi:hypothetical protein
MSGWFGQYRSVSRSTLVETLGSPFSLVLLLSILVSLGLLACLPGFTFGDQLRLIRDQSLALCFIGGCLAASLGAARAIVDDRRRGTAAVVMSRPISSFCFLAGKFTGLLGGVLVIQLAGMVATLWLTRITAYEHGLDQTGLWFYAAGITVALCIMAVKHYLLGGCYVWQANVAILSVFAIAFVLSLFAGGRLATTLGLVDWQSAQASLMIILALGLYTGIVTLLAVLADTGLLLSLSAMLFFAGLLSNYILNSVFSQPVLRLVGSVVFPSWQLFWIGDQLAAGDSVSWSYTLGCAVHAGLYALVMVRLAAFIFENRELQGS